MACSSSKPPVHAMPGYLIRRLQQIAVGIFMDETRGFDLTPVQFAALEAIKARPGLDQIGLSGMIAFDRTTIGGVVERLEAKGLIERRVGTHDRRTRELYITNAGHDMLSAIAEAVAVAQARMLEPLAPQERGQFLAQMERIVEANNDCSRSPVKGG